MASNCGTWRYDPQQKRLPPCCERGARRPGSRPILYHAHGRGATKVPDYGTRRPPLINPRLPAHVGAIPPQSARQLTRRQRGTAVRHKANHPGRIVRLVANLRDILDRGTSRPEDRRIVDRT